MSSARIGIVIVLLLISNLVTFADENPVARSVAALYEGIREETLSNGLRIYLKPIAGAPTVTVMTVYRVGSADEELEQTGLAHYLEHLMFKGTEKLIPGDIDRATRRAGGQNNAYTTQDFTNYHFDFPAERWEVALQIEADRMRNLRIDEKHEFQQEKGAVIAELDSYEDQPYELEHKAILPLLFGGKTPYGHPIIGEKTHVRGATAPVIKAFYDRWYHPNNTIMILVGGFDSEAALTKIKELFGSIPKAKLRERPTPEVVKRDKPVHVEIPSKFEAERFVMGFNTCRIGDPDDYVLDVIESILSSGKTGRLYRRLVIEQEVAGEVVCSNEASRLPGWFSIELEVMKGTDRKKAEKALLSELELLTREPVSDAELKRVVTNLISGLIFQREDCHDLADSIANAVGMADLDYVRGYLSKVQKVTAADVQRVAKKYFDPNQRIVVSSVAAGDKIPLAARTRPRSMLGRKKWARDPRTPAAAAPRIDLQNARRVVLENGLRLVLLENRRLPIVYAQAHVGRVRLFEPADKAGLAALVGLLLEEGTDRKTESEIAETIEGVGGTLSMSPSGGQVKVLAPDRSLGLSLLLECLTRSAFKNDSVRRLKEHVLSEIEDGLRQPPNRGEDEFARIVYADHPFGRPPSGTVETASKLTAADCQAFYRDVFVPNNTILVIVGDFETNAIVDEVKEFTKDWKRRDLPKLQIPSPKPPDKTVHKFISLPDAAQVSLYLGNLGIERKNPDYFKLQVMDNILGLSPAGFTDRLSAKLRERKGLAYSVNASITSSAGEEPGVFSAYVGTYPDELSTVMALVLEEIHRIRNDKATAREVEDAKTYLVNSVPFRLATNASIAGQLLAIERHELGFDYLDRMRRSILEVTADDVQAVAKKYLMPDRLIITAAGPIDERGKPLAPKP